MRLADGLSVNARLSALLADVNLRSDIDHFVNVLDFPRSDLFKSGTETDSQLVPRLRSINTPVATFIRSSSSRGCMLFKARPDQHIRPFRIEDRSVRS